MRSNALTLSRHVFCLIALLWAISGFAGEVPRETLERMAEVNVGLAEIRQLNSIGKLSDAEYYQRKKILDAEQRSLWEPHHLVSQITPQEIQAARTSVAGLTRTKLSLLEPRWAKEQAEFREAGRRRQEQTSIELEKDARTAADFQRQRLLLQRQLDKGSIERDTFTAKDKEAQDSIAALRKKFEAAGGSFPRRFDERLTLLTKALADSPDTILPRSQVSATVEGKGTGRGGEPDFNSDVKLAAELLVNSEEISWKFEKKQVSSDTFRETAKVYNHDLSRLRARYDAIKQGGQFEAAYTRLAAPGLQAVRVKYQPEKYRPPVTIVQKPPAPPQTDFTLAYWLGGGALGLGFLWLVFRKKPGQQADPRSPITDIHGTAKWAPRQLNPEGPLSLCGVMFGKSSHPDLLPQEPGLPVISKPETHTLIVAQTRAGKGTRVIFPTLLRYSPSMLVVDPKGELAAVTARTRRDQLHHQIHIINPWGQLSHVYSKLGFKTATFNPLDMLDRNDPNALSLARSLAAIICPVTPGTKDSFWQGSAASILAAVFLWITDQEGLPRGDDPTQKETKTLARAREIVTQPKSEFQKTLVRLMASKAFGRAIKELVGQAVDPAAPETHGGIMSHLAQCTTFISDIQIKTSTATSSFSMERIRDDRMTIFIVIPADYQEDYSAWLRLVITSAMHALKTRTRIPTPPNHRCMFLIDEFGSIGPIASIPRDLAYMSGTGGLDFTLIVQSLGQLKKNYDKDENTILSNCANKWFCDITDLETAKQLSDMLGKKTVRTVGTSTSTGTSGEHPTAGESTTYGETGRLLLTPDEIMKLGKEAAILLSPGLPQFLRPVDYFKLQEAFAYLRNAQPQLYWQPPITYDDNPYWQDTEKQEREKRERLERERLERERQEKVRQEQAKRDREKQERDKQQQQKPGARTAPMTEKQAREILEIPPDATKDQIKEAYNRLMKRVHPDVGGSKYFAIQLNQAKAVLLGE